MTPFGRGEDAPVLHGADDRRSSNGTPSRRTADCRRAHARGARHRFFLSHSAGDGSWPRRFRRVPLGARETLGVVWALRPGRGDNLKPVSTRLDLPPLRDRLRKFIDWMANWTLAPRGMVLRMGVRAPQNVGQEPLRIGMRATGLPPKRLTPARARVLEAARGGLARTKIRAGASGRRLGRRHPRPGRRWGA